MDDSLEAPTSQKVPLGDVRPEDDEQQSDEEDGGLDWTKLLPASARPVIPKRGEKEFEPRASGGGTNLQVHILDRSRNAMFETLRTTRSISSKAISYGIWHPQIARTEVTVARGIHFGSMGYSSPRSVIGEDGISKIQKRLELLPEEAIYLIERGALFCWKDTNLDFGAISGLNDVLGSPMSVQQAYSEMIGKEDLTLEKFQVFAYLKRLGYVVTRANSRDLYYPTPQTPPLTIPPLSILQRIESLFSSWISNVFLLFRSSFNWWKPISFSRCLHHDKSYASLFRSLRFMPAGHSITLRSSIQAQERRELSPYRIFYNVYKPATPFKKTAPPLPDFQLVVVNARTTPLPTLQELTDLFDVSPEAPLPPPRQKRPQISQGASNTMAPPLNSQPPHPTNVLSSKPALSPSLIHRLFPWIVGAGSSQDLKNPVQRPNPFLALKTGKKIVIIAAVDNGNISFFRFGQGEFSEWPMA